MADSVIDDFILLIAVVVIGLVILGFTFSYFAPREAFSIAEQSASSLSSSSTISTGPLLISKSEGSAVIEIYNPSYNGNYSIFVFPISSTYEQDVGIITPSSTPSFTVYMPNGKLAKQINIDSQIYCVNGKILYDSPITAYSVPSNTPVTINVGGISSSSCIVVIWILYCSSGYWFRIGYTFTGVPST